MDELKEVNISIWVDVCVSDYTNQDIDDFHVDQEKHIKGVISEALRDYYIKLDRKSVV